VLEVNMKFVKMQGAGNDFILVEASNGNRNWSQMARDMCDRHFGIGGDGLLLVLPSDKANVRMREFNSDGSEAEACGNGLRCAAKYTADRKLTGDGTHQISIETMAGIRQARLHKSEGGITRIQVSMGKPEFGAKEIPVVIELGHKESPATKPILDYPITIDGRELLLNLVSMGNPHAVYFWQNLVADFPLSQIGPKVEHHKMFPNRVNFEVANILCYQQIEVRVWERGVGETLACGSGACAVAVIAQKRGYAGKEVDIILPGGALSVEWDGVGEVLQGGPAEEVFIGEWSSEV
jgi:diaminopimelate epimerase